MDKFRLENDNCFTAEFKSASYLIKFAPLHLIIADALIQSNVH